MKRLIALFSVLIASSLLAGLVQARSLSINKVRPKRLHPGSTLELYGPDFSKCRHKPITITLQGVLWKVSEKKPQLVKGTPRLNGHYRSSRMIVHKVSRGSLQALGAGHGLFNGQLQLQCGDGGSSMATGSIKVRALELVPPNLISAAQAIISHPKAVRTISGIASFLVLLVVFGVAGLVLLIFLRNSITAGASGIALRVAAGGLLLAVLGAGCIFAFKPLMGLLIKVFLFDTVVFILLMLIACVVALTFFSLFAGPVTWLERRVAGRMQYRIGPNRTGPQGLLQWLADGLKSFHKEDIIPIWTSKLLFRIAPYLVFTGVFSTFVVLPFGPKWVIADLDVGILFLLAVTSLVIIGIMMGGWSSNNKWSLFGGMRAAAQIVSYEIPVGLTLLSVVIFTGTLSLQEIVRSQGGSPWNWNVFSSPFLMVAFVVYFISIIAEGNRTPFDLPEAESELVSGYVTEYSGMRYLFFMFAEWGNLYVMSAVSTAVFLGGWRVPGLQWFEQQASGGWQLLGCIIFLMKAFTLVFVIIWLRWTLPRLRVDQLMLVCWKYFVPIAFVCFLGTSLWTMIVHVESTGLHVFLKILRILLFIVGLSGAFFILYRAWWHHKTTKSELELNPFL